MKTSMKTIELSNGKRIQFDGDPSNEEIQKVVDQVTSQSQPEGPGVLKSTSQAIAKPFAKFGTSAALSAKGIGNIAETAFDVARAPFSKKQTVQGALQEGIDTFQDIERQRKEGLEWGWFGGNVKPIGTNQQTGEKLSAGRTVADAAGTALEVYSYRLAPILKPGAGFFNIAFSNLVSKASLTFGFGTGLQEYAETGSKGEGAIQGMTDVLGASFGFAAFNKGGQIFSKFGGRLLANEAVRAQGEVFKEFGEKTFAALKDWFAAPTRTLDDVKTSQAFKDAYDGLERDFYTKFQDTASAIADSTKVDYTRDPDVMTRGLTSNIQRQINQAFQIPRATYKSLDDSGFVFKPGSQAEATFNPNDFSINYKDVLDSVDDQYKNVVKAMKKQGKSVEDIVSTPNSMGADVKVKGGDEFVSFMNNIAQKFSKGMSASEFLNTAYKLFNVGKSFPPDQANIARDYANAMFNDGRAALEKAGRTDLIDTWDKGSVQWKQAQQIASSNTLKNLIDSGKIDTFVAKALTDTKKLSLDEKAILEKAFTENPSEVQQLFTNTIADRVKEMIKPPKNGVASPKQFADAADFIDSFLNNKGIMSWGDYAIAPGDVSLFRDFSSFLKTDFDTLLNRMKQVSGKIPEEEEMMMDMMVNKGRLDLAEALKGKDFTTFSESFVNILGKHPVDIAPFVRAMRPEDKRIAGIAILNKLYDESTPMALLRQDGTLNLTEDSFMPAFKKTYDSLLELQRKTGDDSVYGLFDQPFLDEMGDVAQAVLKYENIATVNPMEDLHRIFDGLAGTFYAYRMWFPGAAARYERALHRDPEMAALAKEQLWEEVQNIGLKNGIVLVGDFIQAMAKHPPTPYLIPKAIDAATDTTNSENQ